MRTQPPLSDPRADHVADDRGHGQLPPAAPGARETADLSGPHAQASARSAPGRLPPRDAAGWRLTPGQRKLAVAAHITISVGLLGMSVGMLVLAIAAARTTDPATAQAAYRSMGIFTRSVVPSMAMGAIITGMILSLGTAWGLFRHAWIVTKLGLTVATIACGILVVSPAVQRAIAATASAGTAGPATLGNAPTLLVLGAAANVLMLSAATAISVYKPWGRRRPGQHGV